MFSRRCLLKCVSAAAAASVASPVLRALADGNVGSKDDRFIIIHAQGAWDVTLWADPRNELRGLVEPATTANVDTAGIRNWTNGAPLSDGSISFQLVQRNGFALGPAMGALTDMFDRLTIFNGIATETVSHPDGTYYASTGRHLSGGHPVQTSVDTILSSEIGPSDLFPLMSVRFPSTYMGRGLDPRATPLMVSDVTAVAKSLSRSDLYTQPADRAAVTQALGEEAKTAAAKSWDSSRLEALRTQYDALGKMLSDKALLDTFDGTKLQTTLRRAFFFDNAGGRIVRQFHNSTALNAAFAVEAIKKGLVRTVSFATGASFDTHFSNYTDQPTLQQEMFDILATLVQELDREGLSDRTHILVVSEFCRTPAINANGGRDHHPNNSALVISSKFKRGLIYGKSDVDQLLPTGIVPTATGKRQMTPADVLATFLSAAGVEPRKFLRDGEVLKEVLV